MIRTLIILLALLVTGRFANATIPVTSPSSRVKVDASLWNFRTQQEMDNLIKRNYNNPRASYYIVNNAYQKGFATHAALVYIRNARSKGTFEPKMWVSVAYAAMIGGGRYSFSKSKEPGFMEVVSYTGFLNSKVDEAVAKAPKSPEVLLMSAACVYDSIQGITNSQGYRWDNPQWRKVFSWLRQAQKLDPKWADSYYWYGMALQAYWEETGGTRASLLPRAKSALLTAQQLDPGLKGSASWGLWLVADKMKRPKEQLAYMNTWFKLQPRYAKQPFFRRLHSRLVAQVGKQSNG